MKRLQSSSNIVQVGLPASFADQGVRSCLEHVGEENRFHLEQHEPRVGNRKASLNECVPVARTMVQMIVGKNLHRLTSGRQFPRLFANTFDMTHEFDLFRERGR